MSSLPRIYLTGRIAIEYAGEVVLEERQLPGRQGRLAFVYLALNRHRPVPREELVGTLWSDAPPRELEASFSAVLSKLRAALKKPGIGEIGVDALRRSIELQLPADAWVDVEAAINALDEAEGACRRDDRMTGWTHANVAAAVARRPFLGDEDAPWVHAWRERLKSMLRRALACLADLSALNGEAPLAVQYANEIVELDPYQEPAYQRLMRLHAAAGNRAEALRVFARCREFLREELGASPAPETERLFLEILRA